MKKIVPFWLMLITFILSTVKLVAQIHKLNTAFYYSSGIVADSKGNAFVTGKNNKVIKITPEGKAGLFAGGGRNDKDGKGKEAGFSNTAGMLVRLNPAYFNMKLPKYMPQFLVAYWTWDVGTAQDYWKEQIEKNFDFDALKAMLDK